ncbi:hypothetical protein CF327_g7359 [Tilletia walkeri]|nr:hypothetical protein CF327_g7359 [Tilletia walkeri]
MHPHLSGDSKQARCGDLIQALNECHARSWLARLTGECNSIKSELTLCLRAERIERTKRNNESAKERQAKKEQAWKEIEEEL